MFKTWNGSYKTDNVFDVNEIADIGNHLTYGIVEFPDRIEEVIPSQIKFRDKTSGELKHITQAIKDMNL